MSTDDFLFGHIERLAKARGWSFSPSPNELNNITFRRPAEAGPADEASGTVRAPLLACHTAFLDVYAIIIGSLGESEDHAGECLYSHHRRAAWARSWLDPFTKENIYLLLTGPRGSGAPEKTSWKDVAYKFERDERICRKLVWLPGVDSKQWAREADAFCDRTILSQPWKGSVGAGNIDPVGHILGLPEVPSAWRDTLHNLPEQGRVLADRLVDELDPIPVKRT